MQHFFLRTLGLALAVGALPLAASAQVGLGNPTPNPKAALDITATDKGLLIPRLTEAQRLAITSPPQGLIVYQTDGTASGGAQTGFWYYAGTPAAWVFLNPTPTGDNLGNHTATQNLDLAANQLVGNGGSKGISISSAGNVGVGTTTPSATLEVAGSLYAAGAALAGSVDQPISTATYVTLGNVGQSFQLPASATVTRVVLTSGNAGPTSGTFTFYAGTPGGTVLATQPASYTPGTNNIVLATPVTVGAAGTYSFSTGVTDWSRSSANVYPGGSIYNGTTAGVNDLTFTVFYTTPGNAALYTSTNALVGVGTGTPTAQLDVNGTTRLRGLTTPGVVTTNASGNLSSVDASTLGDDLGDHLATQTLALADNALHLRTATDSNHRLVWSLAPDGPELTGSGGGLLGVRNGGVSTGVLGWRGTGRVGIGTAAASPAVTFHVGGTAGTSNTRLESLGGTGSRMVVADADGDLSTQAIPVNTDAQTLAISGSTLSISGGNSVTLPSGGGAPTGTAGGSLTGTYPNPTIAASAIGPAELATNAVTNAKLADDAVGIAELSATGTPSSSTYLRGDNTWATIAGSTPGWSLSGNTLDGNQFIGSNNNEDVIVKRNGNEAFRVYSNGRISVGNSTPSAASVLLGFNAGYAVSTGVYNVIIGARAGQELNESASTFIGYGAGQNTTGGSNTLMGYYAGNRLTTGTNNVFIGNQVAYNASTTITGTNNIAIGTSAGAALTTNSNNILLGGSTQAGAGLYDAYAFGNNTSVTQSNSLVIGNTRGTNDAVSVGIGISAPSSSLQVNGTFAVGVVNNFGGGGSGSPNGLDQGRINQTTFVGGFYELTPTGASNQYYRLPTASDCPGRIYYLRFNGGTAPVITSGSSNIYDADSTSGASSYTMTTTNRLITVISDGTDWYVSAP
ncbi:hypothetical protein Q5H93_23935 [Hymenobacter sp. ASUV-10]|uniref:Uncharacterized protein n=1 Tax=Hymenobacter aranciens TaxID=3063996 RepID=A0ABT9BJG0_9BACT|nr:hypothetical protein [Hymenobacter sp. ASUV-10]MDO7877808.1 hypothetical protein [Hymenobacter sp. ASUV-10]